MLAAPAHDARRRRGLIDLYAGAELGAYGYEEKAWFLPNVRLDALLAELEARGLSRNLRFREAAAATDEQLQIFHSARHIERVRARCATNEGSLDFVPEPVAADVGRILAALAEASLSRAALRAQVEAESCAGLSFDDCVAWLSGLDLLTGGEALRITPAGEALLRATPLRLPGPTYARAGVERAATFVAGAVLDATERILSGECRRAFVPIAGFHHAHREEARMYCLYNDPALALSWALPRIAGHVAYIDIDIHQGDGVYEGFAGEPRVFIADLHEDHSTLFPFTPESPGTGDFGGRRADDGRGLGKGTKLNLALGVGTTDEQYLAQWAEAEAFIRAAEPRFVVFEAGVDGLGGDPMSHQGLTKAAIYEVTRRVRAIADDCAEGRLLVLGGGGYELSSVAGGWATVVEALLSEP